MLPVKFTDKQLDQFWSKVDKTIHPNGCWIWTAAKDQHGYGRCGTVHGTNKAHRISWMIKNGFLPKSHSCQGVCILHKCDNPSCVNPDHLETGTQGDNMRDAAKKGRTASGDNTGPRRHPESMPRGDAHWSKRFPEKWKKMNEARIESCLKSWAKYRQSKKSLIEGESSVKKVFFMRITKISTEDALNIRAYFYGGSWNQDELARCFSVHQSVISRIVTGSRSWSFLDN